MSNLRDAGEGLQPQADEHVRAWSPPGVEEQRYRTLLELWPDGFLLTDSGGTIRDANNTAVKMLATPGANLLGQSLTSFAIEADRAKLRDVLRQAALSRTPQEWFGRIAPIGAAIFDASVRILAEPAMEDQPARLQLLLRDISSIRRETEHHAREVAEAANRARDQFLSNLSHELRTPLTPALLIVSALQSNPNLPPQVQSDLNVVRQQIDLEARLVDDLLDITRIKRGKLMLRFGTIDLHALLRDLAASAIGPIANRQLKMELDLAAANYHVRADTARLRKIFSNLLENALRCTPPGGKLTIRSYLARESIVVEIMDTGQGIDPRAPPNLFNAFEQSEAVAAAQFGGLGLGLAITQGLIQLHGGDVTAFSEGIGRGSKFTLTLPISGASAVDTAPAAPTSPVSVPQSLPTPSQRVLDILVVEDHVESRRATARVLKVLGHKVQTAGSHAEAVKLLQDRAFDVLLCDISLPDGSGWELMRYAGAARGLALSGHGTEEDRQRSHQAGFAIHLVKPITVEGLKEAVDRLFA